ncbi:hypothetical protein [uncultured Cedecea sp.]|uniref:hypothetical protein n=1 Tax=uncultured Cedecea sp. TaxID=988762 RepID=UPI00262A883C|nr:hypothetical protein [uncultured Cedecea sp.]
MSIYKYPDSIELLEFFENEPFYTNLDDGLTFGYEYSKGDISLLFYFTILEDSATLILKVRDIKIATININNVNKIEISGDKIIITSVEGRNEQIFHAQIKPSILIKNSYC